MAVQIKKINLDYIQDRSKIKQRCKFIVNNFNSIHSYDVRLKDKYGDKTFRYTYNNYRVNFYWQKANAIVQRASKKIAEKQQQQQPVAVTKKKKLVTSRKQLQLT